MMTPLTAIAALLLVSAQDDGNAAKEMVAQAHNDAEMTQAEAARIAELERLVTKKPKDPALLINLGIAHAQAGADDKARAMFERALTSPDQVELETAGGEAIYSRVLARKAIRMLDRGEFTPQISRRD